MRQERGWSQQEAHEHLHEGLGLGSKSRASYIALEAGHAPSAAQQKFLVSYFGKTPDESPEPQPVDLTKLVADLIVELQAERRERAAERAERLEWERGLVSAVQDIARALGQGDDPLPAPLEGALR
jgi:transcriptional regulator with XRE-family HTH domain